MIAFGCVVSEVEPYDAYTAPGIRLASEPDSVTFPFSSVGTLGRSYNLLLEAAGRLDRLEALVIVHPHAEIVDANLCAKLRQALADERVAVVGCAGATGVRSIAWWDGGLVRGSVIHRYTEHGGGELPAFAWAAATPAPAEVEAVDGFLFALSPWAVRELRFDEGLVFSHGVELDLCLRARRAGRTVTVADLSVIYHRGLEQVEVPELWAEAHIQFARKWDGQIGPEPGSIDWKARGRRAEAEREAVRAQAFSHQLAIQARLAELERELSQTTDSMSWRVTRPLRELNLWRRRRAEA